MVDDNHIVLNNFYLQHGYEAVDKLLSQSEKLPEAIVAINDHVAKGAIRALKDKNIAVPEDIAIVSCEYFPGSEYWARRVYEGAAHHSGIAGNLQRDGNPVPGCVAD